VTFAESRDRFADAREIIAAALQVVMTVRNSGEDLLAIREPFDSYSQLIEDAEDGVLGAMALTTANWIISVAETSGRDPVEFYAEWVLEWVRSHPGD
jgi:hypothetical protein